jgi:hypothetical protein
VSSSGPQPPTQIGRRGVVALAVALAVDQIPNVARSRILTNATMYPGGRVDGIVLATESVTVHVIVDYAEYGRSLPIVGNRVLAAARDALKTVDDKRTVVVRIDELAPIHPASGNEAK